MAFFDKLNDLTRTFAARVNESLDETRAKNRMDAEKDAAREALAGAGEILYKRFEAGEEVDEALLPFLTQAKAHFDAVKEAQAEIDRRNAQIEAERLAAQAHDDADDEGVTRECIMCGAQNEAGAKFCRECGARMEAPKPETAPENACPACGAQNEAGAKFCRECGARMSAQQKCPECGASLDAGTRFCRECGAKVSHG